MMQLDKKPPQAQDLEEAVLGILIVRPEKIYEVINMLSVDAFYKEAHKKIYNAILSLNSNNDSIDMLSVTEKLRMNGELEECGGQYYITKLTSHITQTQNVDFNAAIIFQKFIQREVIRISSELYSDSFDQTKDVNDLLDDMNLKVQKVNELTAKISNTKHIGELVRQSLDSLEKREINKKEGKPLGVKTCLRKLDQYTNGWQNTDLIVVAGRPSMGKSAFMLSNCKSAINDGRKPLIFSLEMSGEKLSDRMIIGESGVDALDYKTGSLTAHDWTNIERSIGHFYDANMYIDDTPYVNINYIHSISRIKVKKGEADIIMIDYLQLIKSINRKSITNRDQEISEISRSLKGMAKELNVPVILFAQLNRKVEEGGGMRRPELHHLRESGAIEQDADIVIMLYRAEKYGIEQYESGRSTKRLGEAIVVKFREGPIGTINFRYSEDLTNIKDDSENINYTDNEYGDETPL